MVNLVLRWFLSAFILYIVAQVVPGIRLKGYGASLVAIVIIGLINAFIRPILFFLTLPINILTLGIFTFFLNAFLLMLAARLAPDFEIDDWGSAFIGSILLSIVSAIFHFILT